MSASSRHSAPRPPRPARPAPGRPPRERREPRPGSGVRPADADPGRLTRLLEPVAAAMDMDLEDIRITSAGRRRLVRVIVDADGGVSLDDIALASREISAALDAAGVMGEASYTLEVSSPGVDRPLTQPRHWRRAAGRLVRVPLAGRPPGDAIEGRVLGAGRSGVVLETGGATREFGYAELGPGRIQVEFGRLAEDDAGADDDGGDDAAEEDRNGH